MSKRPYNWHIVWTNDEGEEVKATGADFFADTDEALAGTKTRAEDLLAGWGVLTAVLVWDALAWGGGRAEWWKEYDGE